MLVPTKDTRRKETTKKKKKKKKKKRTSITSLLKASYTMQSNTCMITMQTRGLRHIWLYHLIIPNLSFTCKLYYFISLSKLFIYVYLVTCRFWKEIRGSIKSIKLA